MIAMPTTSLSVIVVGGGIGGLTSAIAMRKAGHKVTVKTLSSTLSFSRTWQQPTHEYSHDLTQVFEKHSLSGEIGAAVGLGSNSVEYLQSLGFDTAGAKICKGEWYKGVSTWSTVA